MKVKFRKLGVFLMMLACMNFLTPELPTTQVTTIEAATKIKINKAKDTLVKGDFTNLSVSNVSDKIKWTTSNKKVATVDSSGKVVAKKNGTATITATVHLKKYTCLITVETPSISKKKSTMLNGNSLTITMKNNTQSIKWESSNTDVATVTKKGVVTAKSEGDTTITAKIDNKTYTCIVTVNAKSEGNGTPTDEQAELARIDTNHDGKVTIAEAKAAGYKMPIYSSFWLYKYMDDRDHDGMVGE